MLASGIEYGLDGLIQACIEFLIKNLTVETASEAIQVVILIFVLYHWQAAVTYSLDDLKATAMRFIEENAAV